MKKRLKLLGIAVGVMAIMALTLGGTVFAAGPHGEGAVCSDTVSELLGLTPEELCDLRQEGKSLAEIAAERDIAVDELVEAIMAVKIEAVQARVNDGTITQEQADLMIQRMAERTELAVNRTSTGPMGMGAGHGRSGEGAGPGLTNRWGAQNGTGAGYGDPETCTGPGSMNRWGK